MTNEIGGTHSVVDLGPDSKREEKALAMGHANPATG